MPPPSAQSPQPPMWAIQLWGETWPLPPRLSQPTSMNIAVIRPQAMKAPMLGMTMLDRNVPNCCTRTRALVPDPAGPDVVVAVVAIVSFPFDQFAATSDGASGDVSDVSHALFTGSMHTNGPNAKHSGIIFCP